MQKQIVVRSFILLASMLFLVACGSGSTLTGTSDYQEQQLVVGVAKERQLVVEEGSENGEVEQEIKVGDQAGTVEVVSAGTESNAYPTLFADLDVYEAATGNKITSFGEAPMLTEMVLAGELPPVEERLPAEPMVVQPLHTIGVYGGELAGPAIDPNCCGWDVLEMRVQKLLTIDTDLQTIVPNVAKGIEASADQTMFTITLREGHKWSDGEPFTSEDFRFYFEDVIQQEKLTPVPFPYLLAGDNEWAQFEVIDETTVRYTFVEPKPNFILTLATEVFNRGYRPAHYFKQFHIDYNPSANEFAQENGFEDWVSQFNAKMTPYNETRSLGSDQEPYAPTLNTFVFVSADTFGNKLYERNRYFFKVDSEGNQLPYTDTLRRILVEDLQEQDRRAIAGEYTHFGWGALKNVPAYQAGAAAGNYRIAFTSNARGNEYSIGFNLNHISPEQNALFNDIRFRQAMSVAINRDEINELVYSGLATPSQVAPTKDSPFYEPWMTSYYAEFDPNKANELLDEIGLDQRDDDGFRKLPSGDTLFIDFRVFVREEAWVKIAGLIAEQWNDVGVKISFEQIDERLYIETIGASRHQVGGWGYETTEIGEFANELSNVRPGSGKRSSAVGWRWWIKTNGERGVEPPQQFQALWALGDEFLSQSYGSDEYLRLGSEFYTQTYSNLYQIGTIQSPPQPLLFKNDLCNTPPNENDTQWSWTYRQWVMFAPEQWYFAPDGEC